MTSSVTGCSTCSRVLTSRKQNAPVGVHDELDGARAGVAERLARGHGGAPTARRAGRRRRPATGTPRRSSGACAGSSSRARTARRRCRARRRGSAPRRGGGRRRSAPGTRCRRRTRTRPPAGRSRRPRPARAASTTIRMPRPPPPNAALTSTGKPMRAASAVRSVPAVDRHAGQRGHPGRRHHRLGLGLRAHGRDRLGRRPDEREPGRRAVAGEPGVLREEPVAGVHGVGAGGAGRRDEQVAAQVRVGGGGAGQPDGLVGERDVGQLGVGVGEHGDGGDAQLVGGAEHAGGDLPAVGHQQLV